MRQKPASCSGCPCHSHGTDFSRVEGSGSLGVMIIAEASGEMEARDQLPLRPYAPAGSLLERTFKRMGLSRQQFSITNTLRCFPGHVVVEAANIKNGFRRWYRGELVSVVTNVGVLSGTPNHPTLTDRGWIPLGLIQEGDYLVRGPIPERMSGSDPNIDWDSLSFNEAFNTLSDRWGRSRVVGSYMDFDGDGIDSYVDIVCSNGFLRCKEDVTRSKHIAQLALESANLERGSSECFSTGDRSSVGLLSTEFASSNGSVGSLGESDTSFTSGATQSFTHSVTASAKTDVHGEESFGCGMWTDAELYREALQSLAREVTLSKVINVERRSWSGHVYNLHTQSEVYTANGFIVHNCRPRNNWLVGSPWEFSALNHCRPNLDAAIRERRPRAILALGDTALRELTGEAGEARGVSHLCGYALPSQLMRLPNMRPCECVKDEGKVDPKCFLCDGAGKIQYGTVADTQPIPVIPTFHPAFIRRGKASLQGIFARHLARAVNVAAGRDREWLWGVDPERKETYGQLRYSLHPSLDEARSFGRTVDGNGAAVISYDIETFESASLDEDARDGFTDTRIRLIQFSIEGGGGIAFPWEGEYREVAARILRSPNVKCGHNLWLFDNKVLEACGLRESLDLRPRGVIHDTLQMFHHWQPDLPAHLQFCAQFVSFPFPWKHLAATDLEFYGCVDVDATLRLYEFLDAALRKEGIYDSPYDASGDCVGGYVGQVQQVRPILAAMERRGLPVDDAMRLKLDGEFDLAQQELDAELQARVPEEVLGLEPRRGKKGNYEYGYLKAPKDTTGLVLRTFTIASVDESTGEPCKSSVERWCRLVPFNANSGPQLLRYMDAKGHKRPKSRETDDEGEEKDTTGKKELVRLANRSGDNFYLKVIEYRELSKARGTYIEGFKPHADGCVHTTFTFDTATAQLSSRNPNCQNFMKHGRLAKATRRMIAAPAGQILVEWDYRAYHVLTTGFCAEDASYIRMARLDMHSFVAGCFLKLWGPEIMEESDASLLDRFRWFKSDPDRKRVRDKQAKPSILGVGFGMGARRLYQENMEHFEGEKTAKQFLDLLQRLFPRVFEWQERTRQHAHERTLLKSPFGHQRRFYEVSRWDYKKAAYTHGDQAEEAVAFLPANIAFGNIRLTMKELERRGISDRYGLCNTIHDSLIFAFDRTLLNGHVAETYPVLVAPSPILRNSVAPDGLWCDVECNAGRNWAPRSDDNPDGMYEVNIKEILNAATTTEVESPALPAGPEPASASTVGVAL